ncbi:hypothetical protein CPB84DRAFT_1841044 [Gymnopilus junonius]|uniref:GATA-type domain-containing protein n=1 Tax=Gymnopilus junonius TaxID=109634 RepID=A0A9P5P574_GYMJU|nr:hypothetical protein CPB84DRAFT_1841044 [Gymnopilus junonius]
MDSLSSFDGYTSYSDASTPRTPSPTDMHFQPDYKHDIDHPIQNIFPTNDDENSGVVVVPPNENQYWSHNSNPNPNPFSFNNTSNNSRGSLLQELYEQEIAEPQSLSPDFHQQSENWPQPQQHLQRPPEYSMMRRATFPYVRHDREDGMQMQPYVQQQYHHQQMLHQQHHHNHPDNLIHFSSRQEGLYGEPHPMEGAHGEHFIPSVTNSPHSSYHEFDENANIKLEDGCAPIMVPSQNSFYRSPPSHPLPMSYLSPHTGLPVQHTDDAASKETQYLRRRCFNCHTTEPPSWRRSTLNPGKIVCNKCGLYERTHLRPRPLRFDELRAGNKARKQSKAGAAGGPNPNGSPKQGKMVKKEPREYGAAALIRRSSVSSSSSVHSGSGASDWDDSVSVYSSGSAPPTSFNSPVQHNFPLSRDASQSPPRDGGIRLPNNPLSDIASMHMGQQQMQNQHTTPRKSHTSPGAYFAPSPALPQNQALPGSASASVNGSPAVGHAELQQQEFFGTEAVSSPPTIPGAVTVGSS